MTRIRRAVDYSTFRHITEQLLIRISGDGWMASLSQRLGWQRLGWQPPVVVEDYTLTLPGVAGDCPPLRLAFASDFHAGPATPPQVLEAACAALAAARPDVLLLGGDFVSLEARHIDPLAGRLGRLPAPFGRFAVLGNHDLWADDHPIVRRLTAANILVLINRCVQLPAPYDHVWICGLDDPTSGTPDAGRMFQGADGTRIVLMHSPDGLPAIQAHRFDLALCGHTHGGQVALPNGRPILIPASSFSRQFSRGHFRLGANADRTMIVSRGVGYGGLPIRLFADPDILVCTLQWR